MKYTEILAVVVSYNGLSKIEQTINALRNRVGHILIVDNASDAATLNIIYSFKTENDISITRLNENKGVGYALNVGVKIAKELGYTWLLTMDQDSIIDPLMIEVFCNAVNRDPRLVCLAPNVIVNGRREKTKNQDVNYAITSGNLVRTSLFDEIGLYNEDLFIDCIDFDFSLRIGQAGYKIYQLHDALMHHELGDGNDYPQFFARFYTAHSPLRRYYMFRNHMYIFEKYIYKFPMFVIKSTVANLLLLALVPIFDENPLVTFRFVFRGIRDYFKGRSGIYMEHP